MDSLCYTLAVQPCSSNMFAVHTVDSKKLAAYFALAIAVCALVIFIWLEFFLEFWEQIACCVIGFSCCLIFFNVLGGGLRWDEKKWFRWFLRFCMTYGVISIACSFIMIFRAFRNSKLNTRLLVSILLFVLNLGVPAYLTRISYKMHGEANTDGSEQDVDEEVPMILISSN